MPRRAINCLQQTLINDGSINIFFLILWHKITLSNLTENPSLESWDFLVFDKPN